MEECQTAAGMPVILHCGHNCNLTRKTNKNDGENVNLIWVENRNVAVRKKTNGKTINLNGAKLKLLAGSKIVNLFLSRGKNITLNRWQNRNYKGKN